MCIHNHLINTCVRIICRWVYHLSNILCARFIKFGILKNDFYVTHSTSLSSLCLSFLPESLQGVEVCGETVLEVTGNEHRKVSWDDFGFHLSVPDGAVPSDVTVSLAVKAITSGQFQLPDDTHLVSSIYWVSGSRVFDKEVSVHIEHCAVINSAAEASNYKFIVGKCSQKNLPYNFKIRDGVFSPQSRLGTINVRQFSFFAAIFRGLRGKCHYMSYCFIKNDTNKPSCWECVFLVTQNLTARVQVKNTTAYVCK